MILKAVFVGLIAAYGRIEQGWLGQQMIARPIWLCTLVGLLLGDLKQGIIIGGSLEFSMNISADDESSTSLFVKWVQDIIDTITDNDSINASGTDAPDFYIRNQDITWENRRNGPNNIYEDQDKTPTTNSEQLKESLGDLTDKIKEDINEK